MMDESRPQTNPARDLARRRMEMVPDLHRVHVAIVWGKDEVHLLEFESVDYRRMIERTIPTFVRDTGATGVVMSSPAPSDAREGIEVAFVERTIETFYVPIVRISNADTLIGDFRPATSSDSNRYEAIREALIINLIVRDN